MKHRHLIALASLCIATTANADTYSIDSRHTFPVFEVSHFGFSVQRGRFNKVTGKLDLNPAAKTGSVDITIDTQSVDMGMEDWNKHMRGERFFQTDKFPQASFSAHNFTFDPEKPASVTGELTLLGVTRNVVLKVGQWRCAKHPILPRELCGADLETSIKRSDFGMNYGLPGIGDDVRISIPVEAIKDVAPIAYVSDQKGNITTIDLASLTTMEEIDIGGGSPRGLGVTPDGKLLVVASRDQGDLAIVDLQTRKVTKRIPIGKNPEFVRVRGDQAFVSFEPASEGGPPPKPGSKEAQELKKKRAEEKEEPARIAVVDLKAGNKIAEITGGMETEGIEFSADGKKIIVTNEEDNNLTIHDIASGKLLKTIDTKPYGNRPRGIKMAPDGKTYVATIEYGNKLVVLDGDFNVLKTVPTGDTPYGIAFSRDGSRLYVALAKGKALQVFDSAKLEPIAEYPIGDRCWHFTFTPDDKHILAACGRSNEVVVVETATGQMVKRIADKLMPWGIVTYPKAFGSLDTPQ